MKTLQIASGDFFSTYGGGQVYVKNIVDEFIRQGCDIAVLSFIGKEEVVNVKNYQGIDLYEVATSDYNTLKGLISKIHPDIIHAHSRKAIIVDIGKKLNIPVIVTSHHGGIVCPAGTLLNSKDEICSVPVCHKACVECCVKNIRGGKFWWQFVKFIPENIYIKLGSFLKKMPFIPFVSPVGEVAVNIVSKQREWNTICKKCTKMIAPSYAMKDAMVRNGLDETRIVVVPHGITFPKEKHEFPDIVDGKVKFFYLGRICYVKGLHVLLEAFHRVDNPKIELHMIGGAGNKAEGKYMKSLQQKYRNDARIIWHGKVSPDKVFDEISNMHVSSSSSFLEAFGLNISESLAMGKPVLATRCGGAEMQIEDGVNGWLVEPNNVMALKEKIEKILSDTSELPYMAGRKKVISIEEHCNILNNIYKLYQNE
jgi:putative glycosyltransferase, forming alpha-gylcosyl linkages protein